MKAQVTDYLTNNPVLMLANVDPEGKPRVRPMISIGLYQSKLWFATTEDKALYKELMNDNRVELANSSVSGKWVRIAGKALFETDKTVCEHVLESSDIMDTFYKNKDQSDNIVKIFYIDIEWGSLSALNTGEIIEF